MSYKDKLLDMNGMKLWFQLPPGAVPIFAGASNDQLRAAIARPQKQATAADGSMSQVGCQCVLDLIVCR